MNKLQYLTQTRFGQTRFVQTYNNEQKGQVIIDLNFRQAVDPIVESELGFEMEMGQQKSIELRLDNYDIIAL